MLTLTIRKIDKNLQLGLRLRAAQHGHSMEDEARQIICNSLTNNVLLEKSSSESILHPLDRYVNTWVEDPAFDAAIENFRKIDKELWE